MSFKSVLGNRVLALPAFYDQAKYSLVSDKPLPPPENHGIFARTKKVVMFHFPSPYKGSFRCALAVTAVLLLLSSMVTDNGGSYYVFVWLSLFFWIAGPIYTLVRPNPKLVDRFLISLGPITPLLVLVLSSVICLIVRK